MYDFIDIDEAARTRAPSILFEYDGVKLDFYIRGFRTLAVHGRTLLSRDVDTKGLDTVGLTGGGGLFLASRLPERELTVEFLLEASDNEGFREKTRQLAMALHRDHVCPLRFSDEPDYTYYGAFAGVSDIEEYRNAIKGEITFLCADPLKYGATREVALREDMTFSVRSDLPLKVDALVAVLGADAPDGFTIERTDGEVLVSLFGSFSKGGVIEVTNKAVTLGGASIMSRLDIRSRIEAMTLSYGDVLKASVPTHVTVRYREVCL